MTTDALPPDENTTQTRSGSGNEVHPTDPNKAVTVSCATATGPSETQRRTLARPGLGAFGAYELLEVVAEGGMGVVYKAHDSSLGRVVALKTLRAGSLAAAEEIERFYREARAAAMLSHPHIVPVYEVGRHNDHHYFCMAFIAGGNLAGRLARFGADPRAAAALVEKVARAVHHAHSKGVLHRDLKPSNILLDERGEPQVSDFGLAKILDADVELTQTGAALGTPPYMSPEQTAGESVGPATDVWSLGVVLYEVLAGRRPFLANDRGGLMQAIRHADPPRPRSLKPDLDSALEIIILKCLEKEPAWRYLSAEALADDLRRWLDGCEIVPPPSRRIARAWRRHSRPFLLAGMGLLATASAVAALWLATTRLAPAPTTVPLSAEEPPRPLIADDLRRQVLRGQTVTLVGETGVEGGRTPALEWTVGQDESTVQASRTQPLEVRSRGKALLELLPEAPASGCLLRAEVQVAGPWAEAGVYFGSRRFALPDAVETLICTLTVDKDAAPTMENDKVEFDLRRIRQSGPGEAPNIGDTAFSRSGLRADVWRRLEVRLDAAGARASSQGLLLGELSGREMGEKFNWLFAAPIHPVNLSYDYNPAGAVGLFVARGEASFRRVVVEPLGKPPRINP